MNDSSVNAKFADDANPASLLKGEDINGAEQGEAAQNNDGVADQFVKAVHPKLADVPRWKGRMIACWAITIAFGFLAGMTLYTFIYDCELKLFMIDADWQQDRDEVADIKFEGYASIFEAPSHICGSYTASNYILTGSSGDNETETVRKVYDIPCLLNDLTCESYGFPQCPDIFFDQNHVCGPNYDEAPPRCGEFNEPLASVVSMECVGFFGAVGVALAYLVYVQLAAVVLGYCIYRCCCATHDETPNQMVHDIKDFVVQGLGGEK